MPKGWILVEQQDGGRVLKSDPNFRNSHERLMKMPERRDMRVADICTYDCELWDHRFRDIDPPGIARGSIQVSSQSWAYIGRFVGSGAPCKVEYNSNTSMASYYDDYSIYGDPDSVTHTDIWKTDYLGFGMSISYPPAGSVSPNSGTLEWSTTVNGTWQTFHDWDRVIMDAGCGVSRLTGVNFGTTGSFQWGSQFYAISSNSGHFVP
ncbi:hypothetical protein [Verrucosispora sioxanthis]|uniref:hypothetical protein n=1 Tax=Verrucosispora sioxanthis TaxID=2499994 RepID=UPI0013DA79F7|nr:hypothetical protein [Verrucosispora sioxanthis]